MKSVALIGYGKMGHEVEKILHDFNIPIGVIIDTESDWNLKWEQFLKCDVAIEFTTPEIAPENFKKCFLNNIPLVSGTTGWYSSFYEIIESAKSMKLDTIYILKGKEVDK